MKHAAILLGLVALLSPFNLVVADDDEALAKRIETLVASLGDSDFDARQAASEELVKIGEPALPALKRAAESDDAEAAWRAKKTIERIEADLAARKNKAEPPVEAEDPDAFGPGMEGLENMEELFRNVPGGAEGIRKLMEESFRRAFEGMGENEGRRFSFRSTGGDRETSFEEDGREYTFKTTRDGKVEGKVVGRTGAEESTREFSYASEEEFEKADPDLFKIYQDHVGEGSGFEFHEGPFHFQFRSEGFEEMQKALEEMRKNMERSFGGFGERDLPEELERMRRRLEGRDEEKWDREVPDREVPDREMPEEGRKAIERATEEAARRAEGHEIRPAFGGLTGSPVDPALRAQLNLEGDRGLLVSEVEPGSQAERFGLVKWDLVLAANGEPVASVADYQRVLEATGEGGEVVLSIVRRGEEKELRATK